MLTAHNQRDSANSECQLTWMLKIVVPEAFMFHSVFTAYILYSLLQMITNRQNLENAATRVYMILAKCSNERIMVL